MRESVFCNFLLIIPKKLKKWYISLGVHNRLKSKTISKPLEWNIANETSSPISEAHFYFPLIYKFMSTTQIHQKTAKLLCLKRNKKKEFEWLIKNRAFQKFNFFPARMVSDFYCFFQVRRTLFTRGEKNKMSNNDY